MSSSDNTKAAQFPPLQISDLLVLTLTISFSLACVAPSIHDRIRSTDSLTGNPLWHDISRQVSDYTAIGVSLFGLLVLSREKFCGRLKSLSPGQWYFIMAGPAAVCFLITARFLPTLYPKTENIEPLFNEALVVAISLSLTVSARGLASSDWQWRVCLLFVFIAMLLIEAFCVWEIGFSFRWWRQEPAFFTLIAAGTTAHCFAAVSALLAVAIDAFKRRQRDWLHYLALIPIGLNAYSHVLSFGDLTVRWWFRLLSYVAFVWRQWQL